MALDIARLNPEQQDAVRTLKGPVLILAGAGTGKTTVITYRFMNLLEKGVHARNILAVTFTNKAAKEMKERIKSQLKGVKNRDLTVSTFHAFCCRVIRENAEHLGFQKNFGITDPRDTIDIIKEIVDNRHLKNSSLTVKDFIAHISNAKNALKTPDVYLNSERQDQQVIGQVYSDYQAKLFTMNMVDFDDLLMKSVQLFEGVPSVLEHYKRRFKYIMVDEYQDTNHCQAALLKLLSMPENNICVVGDDDQSIYGWRGADVENILNFPNIFPGTKVVKLERNYRSTAKILEAANGVISKNRHRHGKALRPANDDGKKVIYFEASDNEEEARVVAKMLRHYHGSHNVAYADMAVLYRSNHLSRAFEIELKKNRIPHRIIGSKAFYERREIKDAIAYLRIMVNQKDDLALLRVINVPTRGVGQTTIENVFAFAKENKMSLFQAFQHPTFQETMSKKARNAVTKFFEVYQQFHDKFKEDIELSQKIHDYLLEIGYLTGLKRIYPNHEEAVGRQENVMEFINAAASFEDQFDDHSLQDYMEANSLLDDMDNSSSDDDEEENGVNLMTVHASKGLEFPVVILVGLEQKLFPHERSIQDRDVDEERRLFYVAVTRAKHHLFITRSKLRAKFNMRERTIPSQFVLEIPEDVIEEKRLGELFRAASKNEVEDQLAQLKAMLQRKQSGK